VNPAQDLDQAREQGLSKLASLPGLQAVSEQLARRIAVLQAEQARRRAGMAITRPAWKNLIFTGAPGSGKSRAAKAVARTYQGLGLLSLATVVEVTAADLASTTSRETATLVSEAARSAIGRILMINDAHAWHHLPDRGQQVLRCLNQELTESRELKRNALAVILAGHAGPLRDLLHASPALAARFPAVIDFPGYTPGQLAAIFATLASEAGLTLTDTAAHKAATVLTQAQNNHGPGNARLAVQLLNEATTSQALRITTTSQPWDPATLSTIQPADIPENLHPHHPPADERPGQYL
jgi:SpoVK/Ycf46/Vps4 family AAA+-type ATPase